MPNFAPNTEKEKMTRKPLMLLAIALTMAACTQKKSETITVVPYPQEVEVKAGTFNAAGAGFHCAGEIDEASMNIINAFAARLSLVSGLESKVDNDLLEEGFNFILDTTLAKEAYSLKIARKGVEVKASSLNGFNYAVQTLKQMLPAGIYGNAAVEEEEWRLQCAKINDSPRFGYRGMHLDVSRHFFDVDMVKRYLDIMEIHKLNTLHWHLTDDQGWRIEIKKYPELTEYGSIRKETLVGHLFQSDTYDGTPYGEGMWYSQEQIKEIIEYAASKGIEIIPEIDLPGHMLAALASYPELGCTGGPYDVWGKWGVADDVLCAGREETMLFLEDVLDEVAGLFPSEYFHIGGDECPKVRWERCPRCQAKIKELGLGDKDGFKAEHYLQSYVMTRMTEFLEKRGKKIIGWDEILEGELAENAIVMSWRGTEGGIKAAQRGHDAIMTPNSFFYLDYYQTEDKDNEPLAIGGYLPVEKCYSYEPCTDEMTPEQQKHILGVQANLWTEYIATNGHLEYMLLPRMAALSEVQWCRPENKSWKRFLNSTDELCAIYDVAGYNYGKHIFNVRGSVKSENGTIYVTLESQGETPVRYTLDGSDPTEESLLYQGPVAITGTCVLKAKAFRPGTETKIFCKEFNSHKAMAKDVTLNSRAHRNYSDGLPFILTDGIRGTENFRSGDWSGWRGEAFDVTADMKGESYSSVVLSTVVVKYDDIFNPVSLSVFTSENGKDFTKVAGIEYEVEGQDAPNGLKQYELSFPETSARYLRIVAEPVQSLPLWHERPGTNGFLFVDEIIVK